MFNYKIKNQKRKNVLIFTIVVSCVFFFVGISKFFVNFLTTSSNFSQALTQNIIQKNVVEMENIAPEVKEPISIIFAGDMNFDRYVRKQALRKGNFNYIFDDFRELFQSANLVVANLEGPITDNDSISLDSEIGSTKNYLFTFPVESAQLLFDENIKLVNIGNNHIYNFGIDGLEQTKSNLDNASVEYFGHVSSTKTQFGDESKSITIDQYKILFVNYNQFINTDISKLNDYIVSQDLEYDAIIMYTHWGLEYEKIANEVIQKIAYNFIDSGVDLIIGSHPHVVQQSEVYKGKKIYYSLGNFIFDQYFDSDVREGLIVKLEIDPNTNEMNFYEYQTFIEIDSSVIIKSR